VIILRQLTIVIFGGTGDLAYKKLYPAFCNLFVKGMLPEKFRIISIGRRKLDNKEYREVVKSKVVKNSKIATTSSIEAFLKNLEYHQLEFTDCESYTALKKNIEEYESDKNTVYDRIFYLATAPKYFEIISNNLSKSKSLDINKDAIKRIIIEKPLGKDLEDARAINQSLCNIFDETEIFRTDHYLGKSMIQNIMVFRFANTIFEPIWNNKCIDNVQITIAEDVGIQDRGRYYEESGALRDMVQSHLLQILALFAMEPPKSLDTESIRNEKVKVLKYMACFDEKDILNNLVLGQYISDEDKKGYKQENYISEDSLTETFVATRIGINNDRWSGVGFYLRTGKRLKRKAAEIVVQFKESNSTDLYKNNLEYKNVLETNLLRIKIQPEEGISLRFNLKEPSTEHLIVDKTMDFCQSNDINLNSYEAYEKLILDAIAGEQALYTRWDEVEVSWAFVDRILNTCLDKKKLLKEYTSGSWGPKESEEMLKKNNLKWWTK